MAFSCEKHVRISTGVATGFEISRFFAMDSDMEIGDAGHGRGSFQPCFREGEYG
jgi:hypothetical protein